MKPQSLEFGCRSNSGRRH
uniref:Uncharacterized protein n=1 Tax=Arundo donax TaxID=35708 RepID=A0A0A9H526_ARUDO